jgi:hypothetical protein
MSRERPLLFEFRRAHQRRGRDRATVRRLSPAIDYWLSAIRVSAAGASGYFRQLPPTRIGKPDGIDQQKRERNREEKRCCDNRAYENPITTGYWLSGAGIFP